MAHDCRIGNRVVIANAVLLAGHVQIGDRAFLGGGAVIHQFCRIGEGAMIGGGARISLDIAPFFLATERNAVDRPERGGPAATWPFTGGHWMRSSVRSARLPPRSATCARSPHRPCSGTFISAEARSLLEFFQVGQRGFARPRVGLANDTADGDE